MAERDVHSMDPEAVTITLTADNGEHIGNFEIHAIRIPLREEFELEEVTEQ